jgi:hypothetical protein
LGEHNVDKSPRYSITPKLLDMKSNLNHEMVHLHISLNMAELGSALQNFKTTFNFMLLFFFSFFFWFKVITPPKVTF